MSVQEKKLERNERNEERHEKYDFGNLFQKGYCDVRGENRRFIKNDKYSTFFHVFQFGPRMDDNRFVHARACAGLRIRSFSRSLAACADPPLY